jgi:hypothetical protein
MSASNPRGRHPEHGDTDGSRPGPHRAGPTQHDTEPTPIWGSANSAEGPVDVGTTGTTTPDRPEYGSANSAEGPASPEYGSTGSAEHSMPPSGSDRAAGVADAVQQGDEPMRPGAKHRRHRLRHEHGGAR